MSTTMYTFARKNLPKNTVELTVKVPWEDIKKEYDSSFEIIRKDLKVEGFRKGKAPKNIAESKIQKDVVYEHLLRSYIPRVYSEILKKEDVRPIISPKVELTKAKENEEWEIKMTTATTPDIKLNNYKEKVKKAKENVKKSDIWVPGKDKEPTEEDKEKQRQAEFQAALEALLSEATVEISDLVIEEEANQRLSKLVDDVQRVGLTMESYLKSKNLTKEQIMDQIKKEIEDTYKMEFLLQKIADEEKINVEQAELDTIFAGIKDEKEKQAVQGNMYYYASLMRKQKTLDYINSL
ncbi:hypothetical protein IPM65_05695 [Candidatus Roizmanbacteria bacterium]|nr:MAG: hypothetical protein IPM65_05695 [Candidatus Roizmanbacteria bacterium]